MSKGSGDTSLVIGGVFVLIVCVVIITFGFITDWTFIPGKLPDAYDLGCYEPTDELKEEYPNTLTFKANFNRDGCIPNVCKPGYSVDQDDKQCKNLPLVYDGCYKINLSGLDVFETTHFIYINSDSELFYDELGIKINNSENINEYNKLFSDLRTASEVITSGKLGYFRKRSGQLQPTKPSNYKYIGYSGDGKSLLFLNDGVAKEVIQYIDPDTNMGSSYYKSYCNDDGDKNKIIYTFRDEYYTFYKIPSFAAYQDYFDIVEQNEEEADTILDGYKLSSTLDDGEDFARFSFSCTGSEMSTDSTLVPLSSCKTQCDNNPQCKGFTYYHIGYFPEDETPNDANDWYKYYDYNDDIFYIRKNTCKFFSDNIDKKQSIYSNCYIKE